MGSMAKHRRKIPPWLVGLSIAIVVFIAVLVAFNILGFGDDPALESLGAVAG